MGSVSRGRWRRGVWGALAPTNGMASWAWLLAAVLLSLLSVSVARPPLTAAKLEGGPQEPEGKQRWMGGGSVCLVCFYKAGVGMVKEIYPFLSNHVIIL